MPLKAGRPRTPIAIRKAQGNPGKRPIPKEPPYAIGEPRKPKFLTARAIEIWDEEKVPLLAADVLRTNHGPAFGAYCQTIADFEKLHAQIMLEGFTVLDRFQQQKPHPSAGQLEALRRGIYLGASQFGSTPESGSKVIEAIVQRQQNEFAELELVQ